jgi:hypothetical protein
MDDSAPPFSSSKIVARDDGTVLTSRNNALSAPGALAGAALRSRVDQGSSGL